MSDAPIHQQRLRALMLAAQKKQQFDTLEEMRNIRMMVVLSFLIEFDCATAKTLLDLLEIQNNAVLTRMVKERFIKIFRWQNSQVYVPTQNGKDWLLQHLDDEQEIQRVQKSRIRRKIGGYSAEHDLLVQRAAIAYARDNARDGEVWRLYKPRKEELEGKVPDAQIVFTRDRGRRAVLIEIERTAKPPVETICAFVSTARSISPITSAAILCTSQKILLNYFACLVALGDLLMVPPSCVQIPGAVQRRGLGPGQRFGWRKTDKLDVAMLDADGEVFDDSVDPLEVAFTQAFWMLALQQENQEWRHWAQRLADLVVERSAALAHQAGERDEALPESSNDLYRIDAIVDHDVDPDDLLAAQRQQGALLIEWLEGPDGQDNPMRSASDLLRARRRYQAWWEAQREQASLVS